MADCGAFDLNCKAKDFAASTVGDALTKAAESMMTTLGKGIAAMGSMWVNVKTPVLTGTGTEPSTIPGSHAPGAEGINTVLGYVTWIAFGICILSLIAGGVHLANPRRSGSSGADRIGIALLATVLVSGATGLVVQLAPPTGAHGSPTVAFLQNSLWWYMAAVAILGVLVGGIRMAWEQRAQAGKDLVRSLLTLAVVSGAGVTVISLLTTACDGFAVWLLDNSLNCDLGTNGTCFGDNMTKVMALSSLNGLGAIGVLTMGLLAFLASIVQIFLMIVRSGMLVILCGTMPIASAATNTQIGGQMFRKMTGWTFAFVIYKAAAAIVYATAFKLVGTHAWQDDGSGLISIITGITMMVMAVFALPALMALIVPAVSAVSSGAGMTAAAAAGAAMLPTGAVQVGRLARGAMSRSGGGTSTPQGATTTPNRRTGGGGGGDSGGTSTPQGATTTPNRPTGGGGGATAAKTGGAAKAAGSGSMTAGAATGAAAATAGVAVPVIAAVKATGAAAGAAKNVAQNATNESAGES